MNPAISGPDSVSIEEPHIHTHTVPPQSGMHSSGDVMHIYVKWSVAGKWEKIAKERKRESEPTSRTDQENPNLNFLTQFIQFSLGSLVIGVIELVVDGEWWMR